MTANLVVQVCLEPKLVAVALEHESVTAASGPPGAGLRHLLAPAERPRRHPPLRETGREVERRADGTVVAMAGHAVTEVGPARLPVLAAAAGYVLCSLTSAQDLGSHTLCVGEVVDVGGEPSVEVLRMEDTRMHYGG